jgi:site-specific DNA-methyltransferase (adenine-specific)
MSKLGAGAAIGGANKLYFGDNLDVLREYVPDESVDLIYLDPPFNSQAHYNVLFQSPKDDRESAQAQAFRDTWTWGDEAEWAYKEVMKAGGGTARLIDALRSALKESNMMAYLVMMAARLHELHRKLKPTGSLYLHCDPTASHYLKIVLDGTFGPDTFVSEIIWKQTGAHGSAKRWAPVHDTILMYGKSDYF